MCLPDKYPRPSEPAEAAELCPRDTSPTSDQQYTIRALRTLCRRNCQPAYGSRTDRQRRQRDPMRQDSVGYHAASAQGLGQQSADLPAADSRSLRAVAPHCARTVGQYAHYINGRECPGGSVYARRLANHLPATPTISSTCVPGRSRTGFRR